MWTLAVAVVAVVVGLVVVVGVGVLIIGVVVLLKVSRRPKNHLRSSRSKSRGARRGFQPVILSFFPFGVVVVVVIVVVGVAMVVVELIMGLLTPKKCLGSFFLVAEVGTIVGLQQRQ